MPTEQCNFRCTYCYEDFAAPRMSDSIVERLKLFVEAQAPQLRRLSLAWFGGEPLLALDIVKDVQRHAQSLGNAYPQLHVFGSMTTNALRLDADTFSDLVSLGVTQYQITLDGPPAAHDGRRVRRGGQGSFDQIWANLLAAAKSDLAFEILLRVHIHHEDLAETQELLRECESVFAGDDRFRFTFVRVGGRRKKFGEERTIVSQAEEAARSQELGLFEPVPSQSVCYAARPNSFVVRSDGRIGKCTVALNHDLNTVGRILEDGQLELDEAKLQGWMRGLSTGDKGELGCPKRGFADGVSEAGGDNESAGPTLNVLST